MNQSRHISIQNAVASGLLSEEEVSVVESGDHPTVSDVEPELILQKLVEKGSLTSFQADTIRDHDPKSLVFGEYILRDKLGQGGMGVVYRAIHRRMDRVVALKQLPASAMLSPSLVQRFYREVKVAARLAHPNIVTAYDAGEAHGTHFLVMEFVDGKDLSATLMQRGTLPVAEAVDYVLQAARGLAYAHECGVIHRDIKPGNILLASDGTVKILDMGLARLNEEASAAEPEVSVTAAGRFLGTAEYMAPEQAMDAHAADHRADVYSLGCTLYRLITGKTPYAGKSTIEIVVAQREQPIPSLSSANLQVPAPLESIFRRMVAKKPEDRFQSMRHVVEALEDCVSSGGVPAFRPASSKGTSEHNIAQRDVPRGAIGRFIRRRSVQAVAGVLIGVILIVALLYGGGILGGPTAKESDPAASTAKSANTAVTRSAIAAPPSLKITTHKDHIILDLGGGVTMKLLWIEPGDFPKGSDTELKVDRIATGFYIGETEVTQAQWQAVMATTPWRGQKCVMEGGNYPATYVTWREAQKFVRTLSEFSDRKFRLPLEAEWEYACRAGTTTAFSFGDQVEELSDHAWWGGTQGNGNAMNEQYAHQVKMKKPNPWGLYDMHGNAWEWCEDSYEESDRALRGGGWSLDTGYSRTAFRGRNVPNYFADDGGFRLVMDLPLPPGIRPIITNSVGMKLVWIKPGSFDRGSPEAEPLRDAGETQHRVTLTSGYYIGTTEVTQAQWKAVMTTDPSQFRGDDLPVEMISWHEASDFCRTLSAREGRTYRLPTEAEWEYACRAGTTTAFHEGSRKSDIDAVAWFGRNLGTSQGRTHPVGSKEPNAWGLFDMHGNAQEWCADWHGPYTADPVTDPTGPADGTTRVLRGGGWNHVRSNIRSASRDPQPPEKRGPTHGFRVVMDNRPTIATDKPAAP